MKLPTTLLQTLAAAVASLGVAGCGPAEPNEPPTETPAPTGVTEPKPQSAPQTNPQTPEPVNKPNQRPDFYCGPCGMG